MAIKGSISSNSSFKEGSQTCYSLKISMNGKASIFRIHQALVEIIVAFQRSHNALQLGQNPSKIALKPLKLSAYNLLVQHLCCCRSRYTMAAATLKIISYLLHQGISNVYYLVSYLCHQGIRNQNLCQVSTYLRTRYHARGQKELCQDSSIYSKASVHSHAIQYNTIYAKK